jgi:hypothetical protein
MAERRSASGTGVAERAGHSVEVLLRVYAKCLDDGDQAATGRPADHRQRARA